jgi:triacylglycerol esterase/lipase EstA (alpha/beta hydrolase family)
MRLLLGGLVLALVSTLGPAAPSGADGFPIPLPTSPDGDPVGANDWSCRPTAKRPEPVIIVHGTFGDRKHLLDNLSSAMVDKGFCVFSLDYGNRGTGDVARSAGTLKKFTSRVLAKTGASKVSLVGHSQGGMMPRYYIRFLGGDAVVDDLIGLSPSNHGTAVVGNPLLPITGPALDILCLSCHQQAAGSPFLNKLNRGDETPGDVSYTQISTRYDEVVVPYSSAFLAEGPRTTNLTIQDACPSALQEHVLIPMSRTAIAWVLDALTHDGPARRGYNPGCGATTTGRLMVAQKR